MRSALKRSGRNCLQRLCRWEQSSTGTRERTIASTLNISIPGVDSEAAIVALKDVVALSNGSACTSQSYEPSHVLVAAGLPEERIEGALRCPGDTSTRDVPLESIAQRLGPSVPTDTQ